MSAIFHQDGSIPFLAVIIEELNKSDDYFFYFEPEAVAEPANH